ncbi:MAG: hypothetical protein RLZZ574_151 [Cyanobacteriota bacterium]|jgi:Tfp pilus assembly PilM family ATPase
MHTSKNENYDYCSQVIRLYRRLQEAKLEKTFHETLGDPILADMSRKRVKRLVKRIRRLYVKSRGL